MEPHAHGRAQFSRACRPGGRQRLYAEAWADEVDFSAFNGWEQILHINQQCMMMIQVKRQNDRYSYGQLVITTPGKRWRDASARRWHAGAARSPGHQ